MPIVFENADVAAKYSPARETDGKVHVPAGKSVPGQPAPVGYAGPLSKITLAAADKAFASGSNIIKLKEAAKTIASSNAVKKEEKKETVTP